MGRIPRFTILIASLTVACIDASHQMEFEIRSKRDISGSYRENNIQGRIEKGYYVEILIGTPPQALNILLDTGSSNFAIASQENPLVTKYYHADESTTRTDMGIKDIDIEYIEGFWKGHLITDIITVPSANLSEPARVDIVEITDSKKFFINESGWQGILGLAYTELTRPDDKTVTSFMQSVVQQTGIDDIFSIKLCMADVKKFQDNVSGTLILGGYDRSLNPLYWTKIVREWYYDVLVLGMKVGDEIISVDCSEYNNDKSIVDSGTTNIRLPKKIFDDVVDSIQRYIAHDMDINNISEFWEGKDVLCWDHDYDPYQFFPTLTLYLPSTEYNYTITLSVHAQHYILYSGDNLNNEACYKFGISSSDTGTVLGAVLMEEYNVIFDREHQRVGFATSNCSSTSNLEYTKGYYNTTSCVHISESTITPMQIAMYALLGVILLCMVPFCILIAVWCCKGSKSNAGDTDNLLENSAMSSK